MTGLVRTRFLRKRPDADYASVPVRKEAKPPRGPRRKLCSCCRVSFVPMTPMGRACSIDCAIKLAVKVREAVERKVARADRAATKVALEQHKPIAYWLAKVERVCNEYVRARDPNICISCGVTHSSAWQAGHYISVGANGTLRFNEDNIHKQCIQCNIFKGSNATAYRIGLLEKIGVARVEALEAWHPPVKMTRAACEELETHYRAKLRALTKEST